MAAGIRHGSAALIFAAALALAPLVLAHGPDVRVSYGRVAPPVLTIYAGDTVHFHNANSGGGACTVTASDGAFAGPALGRREGWHHTFERPGTYDYFVAEFPSAKGQIVVAPAPEP